jgi:hypothetical protein
MNYIPGQHCVPERVAFQNIFTLINRLRIDARLITIKLINAIIIFEQSYLNLLFSKITN